MKKMLLTLFCLLLLTGSAFAAEVTALDTQCVVEENGSCTVALTVEVAFSQVEERFLLPLPSDARSISVPGYNVRKEWKSNCVLLTVSAPNGLQGTQKITVNYELPEAALQDGSTQLLQLPLLSAQWPCKISGYRLSVTMPKAFDALPEFESGYFGTLIENYMDISVDGCNLTAVLSQQLKDHESLTLQMELEDGYFDLRFRSGKSATLDVIAFWFLFAVAAAFWFFFLRGKLFRAQVQAMPPVGSNAGAIAYTLLQRPADLALMVTYWASLGYLAIARTHDGRVYLQRRIEMGNECKAYELEIFDALFASSDLCTVGSRDYAHAGEVAQRCTGAYWSGKLFRSSLPLTQILQGIGALAGLFAALLSFDALLPATPSRWVFIILLTIPGTLAGFLVQKLPGALFRPHVLRRAALPLAAVVFCILFGALSGVTGLACVNVLLQLLIGAATLFGTRRTKQGQSLLEEFLGFRRYLRTANEAQLEAFLQEDPRYFYNTLPYAAALGVARLFALRFGSRKLEACPWLTFADAAPKTPLGFCARYEQVLDTLRGDTVTDRLLRRLRQRLRRKPM